MPVDKVSSIRAQLDNHTFQTAKSCTTFGGRTFKVEDALGKTPLKTTLESIKKFTPTSTLTEKLVFIDTHFARLYKCETELKGELSKFTRSVFEDVIALATNPKLDESGKEKVDLGLTLLSKLDEENKETYQSILVRHLQANKDLKGIAQIYKSQLKNVDIDLDNMTKAEIQKWLKTEPELQKLPPLLQMHYKEREPYEKDMIRLLNTILEKDLKPTKDERKQLDSFLIYAYGNSEFNTRLRSMHQKSKAHEFVSDFIFATTGSKIELTGSAKVSSSMLDQQIQEVEEKLNTIHVKKFNDSMPGLERDIYIELVKAGKGSEAHEKLESFFDYYTELSCSGMSLWEIRRSPELINKIDETVKALSKIKTKGPQSNAEAALKKLKKECGELKKAVNQFKDTSVAEEDKLNYKVFRKIAQFGSFAGKLEKIGAFTSPIMINFKDQCIKANNLEYEIANVSTIMMDYHAGDVTIQDEVLMKNYKGSSSLALSKFSLIRDIGKIKELISTLLNKGIWAIQPYFTGSRMHTSLVIPPQMQLLYNKKNQKYESVLLPLPNDKKTADWVPMYTTNSPHTLDIRGKVSMNQSCSSESMYEVRYRPDFSKILKNPDENLAVEAQNIFAQALQDYAGSRDDGAEEIGEIMNWQNLQKFRLSGKKAVASYIMSLVPRIGQLKQKVANAFLYLFGPEGKLRSLVNKLLRRARTHQQAQEVVDAMHERFCSELVAEMLKAALQKTENRLQEIHGEKGKPYLHDVFPKKTDLSEIHPNMLDKIVNKYFINLGRPETLDKLFTKVPDTLIRK